MDLVLDLLGDFAGLLFVLFFGGLMIVLAVAGKNRPGRNLRDIPAFTRLRRAVGLAVEAGTRIHLSLGRGNLTGLQGGSVLIGLTMLERCSRAASVSDRPPIATSGDATVTILSQDTLNDTYRALGAESQYDPSNGRLSGLTPFAYAAGAVPVIHDENVAVNVLAGHFGSEAALLTEAAERTNGLTIAGSDSLTGQAVLYATAQEALVGEDLYAGGAYLGAAPMHAASLRAQDIIRWLIILITLIGSLAKLGGLW